MIFRSILFAERESTETPQEPAFFKDLNLDQVVEAVTAGKQEYDLKPFFYAPLCDVELVEYRQRVMQDLEDASLRGNIKAFAQKMSTMRRYLALIAKLDFEHHRQGWFLEAADMYCQAVEGLARDLGLASLESRGMLAFREYLTAYVQSELFTALQAEVRSLRAELATVSYCIIIKGSQVKVRKYELETDYSAEVEATFAKFKQGAAKDYLVKPPVGSGMNHVEAKILSLVARLYPDIFAHLEQFCVRYANFVDETIRTFDREIEFYIAYLEYIGRMRRVGLEFCYPHVSDRSKEVYNEEGFDLALAEHLIAADLPIVCNDFALSGRERVIVVTGPNQGGKTTFARTFGQLHYLASLGCPVPGRRAQLFLYDYLFTHFEREEDIRSLRGKLQDDVVRIHAILERATANSVIILNEIFTSTTLQDGVFLSTQVLQRIVELDALCVWVTFIDELASFSEKTVSMVSTVDPENPAVRTFKIVRRPADGLAYAISIAEKYRLTYHQLRERIKT